MKYIDRFINYIFSLFVLILSGVVCLISAGFVEYSFISNTISNTLFSDANRTTTCISSIVVFILALKTTLFLSRLSQKNDAGIMVDTTNGKVQIANDTIEGTAKSIARKHDSVKDVNVKMVRAKKGIDIYMSLLVLPDTNIMELTSSIQNEVKESIEGMVGVRVNNVDIRIKNINDSKKITKAKEEVKAPTETEVAVVNDETIIQNTTDVEPNEEVEVPVEQDINETESIEEINENVEEETKK